MHSKIVWLFRLIFTDCRPTFSLAIVCLLLVLHMYWSKGFLYLLFLLNFNATWPHGKFESCWKIFLYSFSFYNVIYYTKVKIFLHFLGMFTQQNNGFVDFISELLRVSLLLKSFWKKTGEKKYQEVVDYAVLRCQGLCMHPIYSPATREDWVHSSTGNQESQ